MKPSTKNAIPPVSQADFDDGGKPAKPLTKQQLRAIIQMTYYRACLMRTENKWSPAEEAAFFSGAMSTFFACGGNLEIPACWVFTGNESLLDKLARWKAEGRQLVK